MAAGIEEARLALDNDLARRLRGHARRLGVSTASLCHLAWARVLSKVCRTRGCGLWHGAVRTHARWRRRRPCDGAVYEHAAHSGSRIDQLGVEASVRQVHHLLADLMRHEHASLALGAALQRGSRCRRRCSPHY